jgi:hypothetical protein
LKSKLHRAASQTTERQFEVLPITRHGLVW